MRGPWFEHDHAAASALVTANRSRLAVSKMVRSFNLFSQVVSLGLGGRPLDSISVHFVRRAAVRPPTLPLLLVFQFHHVFFKEFHDGFNSQGGNAR